VPDLSYPSDPTAGGVAAYWNGRWTAFGGTSVAAPVNAGLFVDINQGCYSQLGRVGPALYAAEQADSDTFTDITLATMTSPATTPGNSWPPRLRCRQRPRHTRRPEPGSGTAGRRRLSFGGRLSPDAGPVSGAGAITITGGGFGNVTSVTFGAVGPGHIVAQTATTITVVPPNAGSAQCVDVTVANAQARRPSRRPTTTDSVGI